MLVSSAQNQHSQDDSGSRGGALGASLQLTGSGSGGLLPQSPSYTALQLPSSVSPASNGDAEASAGSGMVSFSSPRAMSGV